MTFKIKDLMSDAAYMLGRQFSNGQPKRELRVMMIRNALLVTSVFTVMTLSIPQTVEAAILGWNFSVSGDFAPGNDLDEPPVNVPSPGLIEGMFFADESALDDGVIDVSEVTDWMVSWDGGATALVPDLEHSAGAGDILSQFFFDGVMFTFNSFNSDDDISVIASNFTRSLGLVVSRTNNTNEFDAAFSSGNSRHPGYTTNPQVTVTAKVPEPGLSLLSLLGSFVIFGFGLSKKKNLE